MEGIVQEGEDEEEGVSGKKEQWQVRYITLDGKGDIVTTKAHYGAYMELCSYIPEEGRRQARTDHIQRG